MNEMPTVTLRVVPADAAMGRGEDTVRTLPCRYWNCENIQATSFFVPDHLSQSCHGATKKEKKNYYYYDRGVMLLLQ